MTGPCFDAHCHLQDPRLNRRIPEVLARAREAGVAHMACCATREADWDRVLDLARDHAGVVPMLGLHPWFAGDAEPGWAGRLRARLGRAGIGECGLDFGPGRPGREVQEAAFLAQLRLAMDLDRPVAIHCVRAWGRLVELLRATGIPAAGAMVHGFGGSPEVAAELQGLGLHLSFSGAAVRPGARRGPLALAAAAADRLLLESDAPFGAAAGEASEPAGLWPLILAAARIRQADPERLAAEVHGNALRFFRRLLP
jgi:TatD DNase family protein